MIIRSSAVFHRQKAQTHFFNCPRYVGLLHLLHGSCERLSFFHTRQLAKVPSVGELRGSDAIMDTPDDADIYETKLRDGDLVIAYVG